VNSVRCAHYMYVCMYVCIYVIGMRLVVYTNCILGKRSVYDAAEMLSVDKLQFSTDSFFHIYIYIYYSTSLKRRMFLIWFE